MLEAGVLLYIFGITVSFIIGIFITRWIFGIGKIIDALQQQNVYALTEIRLLKKMLLNQGNTHEEIDEIIEKGNQKKEKPKTIIEKLNESF